MKKVFGEVLDRKESFLDCKNIFLKSPQIYIFTKA